MSSSPIRLLDFICSFHTSLPGKFLNLCASFVKWSSNTYANSLLVSSFFLVIPFLNANEMFTQIFLLLRLLYTRKSFISFNGAEGMIYLFLFYPILKLSANYNCLLTFGKLRNVSCLITNFFFVVM